MQETSLISKILKEEWDKLTSTEKSLVKTYIRQIQNDKISFKLTNEINKLHEKYPDFHIGCVQ